MRNRPTETPHAPGDEDSPKICYCMHVHEATLVRVIEAGASTIEQLAETTRAGTGCGTCRSELHRLLRVRAGSNGE